MPTIELDEREIHTLTNALRVAAERFDEHVKTGQQTGHHRLQEQFERQASAARALAQRLEELG